MALRQLANGKTAAERRKDVDDGVERAKEAVKLDVRDGRSWLVLGNAYLSAFFLTCLLYTSPSPRDLSTSRMPSSA